jgi:hypothetical protein
MEWEDVEDAKLKTRLEAMEAKLDTQDKDRLLPKEAWIKWKQGSTGKQGDPSFLDA